MEKENNRPSGTSGQQAAKTLESKMQQMNLEDVAPEETPESVKFRTLPQAIQKRLLVVYPTVLASMMRQYCNGDDCESTMVRGFESCSEMLRIPNGNGDNAIATALLNREDQRAEKLMELAFKKNPAALDDRSKFGETLLMLSTSNSSAAKLMGRLLSRDPTQIHRLYDDDGRNFLHHCTLEDQIDALDVALKLTASLIQSDRLKKSQVAAAIHMNDRSGDTMMHMMATRNRRDKLSLLVKFCKVTEIHINLDERQHRANRWTPLMSAAAAGAVEAAEFLLQCGADPTEMDSEARTAADLSAENATMMKLLSAVSQEEEEAASDVPAAPAEAAAAAAAPAWISQSKPTRTVDSGMGTCGDPQASAASAAASAPAELQQQQQHQTYALSEDEIASVEGGLRGCGKEAAFLEAFTASHGSKVLLAQLSEKPVASLISQLAHDPQCRGLVRDALRQVGEAQLLVSGL